MLDALTRAAALVVMRQAMSELNRFIGEQLLDICQESDELFAHFGCGNIRAFTPFKLSCPAKDLVGKVVQSIKFEESEALVVRLNGATIEISLQPIDYTGPEAFCARFNNGAIVVG